MAATRPLGRSGIEVGPLALGGNVFGWTADAKASHAVLDAFVETGLNLVDTADMYSIWAPGHKGGESETVLGEWLAKPGNRDKIVLATKVGMDMGPGGKGLGKAHILESVDNSLRRLQTDHIDLYQSHCDDADTPLEETLAAYAMLIQQGKVRAIGASNHTAERLAAALEVSRANNLPRYETLQPHYNLVERPLFEGPLQDLCVREGLGVIPYWSLASGFLTGKYRSEADAEGRARAGGVTKYLNDHGFSVLRALDALAAELHTTPARVALAWLMTRPSITAPIASATSVEQVRDITEAVHLDLPPDALALLEAASAA
jgi:aryl-alcohol dehydrogenase-like predicted oxidoreductase